MIDPEEWPDDWGILFAAHASDKIYGKVRLNKFLSLLQREGFPIKNKFIIAEMGPYDKNVAIQAEKLCDKGLISIEEKDINQDSPLYIYEITTEGRNYTKDNIIPLLNKMPDRVAFRCSFISVRDFVIYNKLGKIVGDVHKQLYLDDPSQFLTELKKTQGRIDDDFKYVKKKSIDYCNIYLDYLGFFEFTNESLNKIINGLSDDPFVGKNHVLYSAMKLIERFELIKEHVEKKLKDCIKEKSCNEYPCPVYDKMLNHRFRCIEYNSDLYGINAAIDHLNTDFGEMFGTNTVSNESINVT